MANRNWWVTHDPYWWRGTGNSGPDAPDEPPPQIFDPPIGNGLWPMLQRSADVGANQTPWSSVLPSANLSPVSEYESPVARTLRQLSPNWPGADGSLGPTPPHEPPLPALHGAYIGNAFWPTPSSSADIGGGQTPSWQLSAPADQPALSAPTAGLPRSASDFMPSRVPMPASVGGFPAADWPGASAFDSSTSSASPMPVGYADRMRPPLWGAVPDVFGPWREHFIKGFEGAINYLRNRSRASGGGGEKKNQCDERYQEELKECKDRRWQMPNPDYYWGCRDRAYERWLSCMKNGGKPHPDEVPKWNDGDEETWINPHR